MNIFVGNLSPEVTEDELRQVFAIFGQVTSIILVNDSSIGSGQGRGCGYVEMPSVAQGESAIDQLQGKSIKGRPLSVIKALPVTRKHSSESDGMDEIWGFSRKSGYKAGRWRKS